MDPVLRRVSRIASLRRSLESTLSGPNVDVDDGEVLLSAVFQVAVVAGRKHGETRESFLAGAARVWDGTQSLEDPK